MAQNQLALHKDLYQKIYARKSQVEEWFTTKAAKAPPPFYCSIDLRDSGHKIVPVDNNLFPAGFNNICPEDLRAGVAIAKNQIEKIKKNVKRILIIPENHTENKYYIENLIVQKELLEGAEFEVKIGWYVKDQDIKDPITLVSESKKTVQAFPIEMENSKLKVASFEPDLILLNNDFSSGYPEIFDKVSQPIVPTYKLGWHTRTKYNHFKFYNRLAAEFSEFIGIDPWILQVLTEVVDPVHFDSESGLDKVAQESTKMIETIQSQYQKRNIKRKPFVFVKNNAGTYGMGVLPVHSGDELLNLNRRLKHQMTVGKNKSAIKSVIVQEGVPTVTLINRLAAEPVIYLMGCDLFGGFLRTNTEKGDEENLNSKGMAFKKLCMSDLQSVMLDEPTEDRTLELVYGCVARLSALALGLEIASLK